MPYNPQIHHRRSIRLKGYDYSQAGAYFITLCVKDRIPLFGKILNGEMILNHAGNIVKEEWIKTLVIRPNTELGEFIIMPNHFHAILILNSQFKEKTGSLPDSPENTKKEHTNFKSPSQTIGAIIRGFKGATTKRINLISNCSNSTGGYALTSNELQFALTGSIWQRNYYENIIRSKRAYHKISKYIIHNPNKWIEDQFHEQ